MHECGFILPLDLELSYSGLLYQDMTSKLINFWHHGWVLIQFLVFIVVVHIVAYAEELLTVVGAGQEDACHTYDVVLRDAVDVRWVSL
jgi:hypothetical protein